MKIVFYSKFALDGIVKNKKLYLPYILTCIGMIMMYYIIFSLSVTPVLNNIFGGSTIGIILEFAGQIVGVFALIFLFYTNSFLIRRRKKEFGLYNILGMNKFNIVMIELAETLLIAVISLTVGTIMGIILFKLFELGLVNVITASIDYNYFVSFDIIIKTLKTFGFIFALLLLNNIRQISLNNPLELLKSENVGEKAPKANYIIGILGLIILIGAYYIAVTTTTGLGTLGNFFMAVILVIIATYLIFIASSVVLCRILQKNKRYYYKPNHFVAVSSMVYRMKRNGAGLASICILLTMVLVMLSSTVTLYIGIDDMNNIRYPQDINISAKNDNIELLGNTTSDEIKNNIDEVLKLHNANKKNVIDYMVCSFDGALKNNVLYTREDDENYSEIDITIVYVVSLSDYNRIFNKNETLLEDEILIYPFRIEYDYPTFNINDTSYKVKDVVDKMLVNANSAMTIVPTIYVITNDVENFAKDEDKMSEWLYSFDLDASKEEQITITKILEEQLNFVVVEGEEAEKASYYVLFGGIFYIGILLSIVFAIATILIIYYKQISEGYEDKIRFEIMQKVGMTKSEIKKSINSQILTVFFAPLVMAGIHLCFAFPVIKEILNMFNLTNTRLFVTTTVETFIVLAVLYTIIYKVTSNMYYKIVSGKRK